ncbi:AMP-binding protein [Actinomadura madurae]|uniref:AMP-binding protein n=1 Tax=Actinomadura madurae TaxID=1993 RepID=UPI0020D24D0D|nr:AMP-binding protein [Actinomadura madurae]MCQ0020773.1 AMP-binding protein [Actinomadura madurae]
MLNFDGYRNVAEAFAGRVAAHPDRMALSIVRGPAAGDHEILTYAELGRRARVRAAGLAARLAPGDRVVIALPTCTEYVETYLACLFAGPRGGAGPGARPVARRHAAHRDHRRLRAASRRHHEGRPGAARRPAQRSRARAGAGRGRGEAGPGEPPAGTPHRPGPDTLAVLQYSSGSTATPKGVMLGHGNILADMGAISAGTGAGAEDSIGSWLPLHHDMGLFLHLTAGLMFGNPIALMPATAFVRRPLEWLRMMERYASTITGGPNFAFELCTRLIRDDDLDTLDLSRLRIIHNGSEPIHAPTLAAFAKRFARTGLRPGRSRRRTGWRRPRCS